SIALLRFLKDKIEGIDAVSPCEVKIALKAGFTPNKIMLTTPALINEDLNYLLKKNIVINADSFSQIDQIAKNCKFLRNGNQGKSLN
ncbi:MAG: hypothetical protein QME61_04105, partial [Patescibacteria group bacterium]|nr:hypothetical protein [Patescibacteria group bacterium]